MRICESGKGMLEPVFQIQLTPKPLRLLFKIMSRRIPVFMTDELHAYQRTVREFKGGHLTVNHGLGEYSRDGVNTNTAESFFALLKRGVYGTFHSVSRRHLHRYCSELSFRWNNRDVTDGERTQTAIRNAEGKRLSYV
jgi:hypothetical protein